VVIDVRPNVSIFNLVSVNSGVAVAMTPQPK
jgi:hypothetical protein